MEDFSLKIYDVPDLQDKINKAIKILKLAELQAKKFNEPVEIAFSGGKDSSVLLDLAKRSGINYRAIYKNTTIDPPGTKKFVIDNKVEIITPKISFFDLIKKKGYPSFTRRFCCKFLKEYKILNTCCTGVRKDESQKRRKRYKSFEECRIYSKKNRVRMFYPILDFTQKDIERYIKQNNIKCAPIYYKNGVFDVNIRLGCCGCPLKTDRGLKDFKENPKLLKAWLKAGKVYSENHKTRFKDHYEAFICLVFFKSFEEFEYSKSCGLFNDTYDCKKKIEEIFNVKL